MNFLRDRVDLWYDKIKSKIFAETEDDPEIAHEKFVRIARIIHRMGLERLLFNCSENSNHLTFEISNAGGFNKNGSIPPTFLNYLGFDRVVVGTVTGDAWEGNPRPRIKRYPETSSMVNWMGLPGVGAEEVARNLKSYGFHKVPITINLMSTPGKEGQKLLDDLKKTISLTRDLPFVDRYELNISCPNTLGSSGSMDARKEYMNQLDDMLSVVCGESYPFQKVWEKVSPDQDLEGVRDTIQISKEHSRIAGFTIANTTTFHNPRFITSPPNQEGNGGASGNAVYERTGKVQKMFYEEIINQDLPYRIISCGGLSSTEKVLERTMNGDKMIEGIQIFTPLIFEGPRLIRELRRN